MLYEVITGVIPVNLGTGQGYSVLEVVKAFEKASGKSVPYRIVDRRPGDVAACYADPSLALNLLGWRAEMDINTRITSYNVCYTKLLR